MIVKWTTAAELDRMDVMDYIAEDSVRAALEMDELFGASAARLADFPMLGKPGLVAGTRELVAHENYRLVYEIDQADKTVWILTLIHTSRRWPPIR